MSLLNNADDGIGIGADGIGRKASIKMVRKNMQMRRGPSGFEWSIVGGANSLPYKGKSGLFISQLVPGGVAHSAGFRVDDSLLAVNGNDLRGLTHQEAIQCIQTAGDRLELLIEREQRQLLLDDGRFLPEASAAISAPRPPERCCTMIVRNKCGLPGFTVSGAGRWPDDPFTVDRVDVAESSLRSGDRILSVGGTNVKFGARLDQVKTLLAGFPGTRVEVVVERGGDWPPPTASRMAPKLPPKRYGAAAATASTAPTSAFGELTLTRSLPSLFVPELNGGSGGGGSGDQNDNGFSSSPVAHRQQPASSSSPVAAAVVASVARNNHQSPSPSSPYRPQQQQQQLQHRTSFNNLLLMDNSNNSSNVGRAVQAVHQQQQQPKSEMLRASTPIEYPAEQPTTSPTTKAVPAAVGDQQQQHMRPQQNAQPQQMLNSSPSSTSFSTRIDNKDIVNNNNESGNDRLRQFAVTTPTATTAGDSANANNVSPPLPPKIVATVNNNGTAISGSYQYQNGNGTTTSSTIIDANHNHHHHQHHGVPMPPSVVTPSTMAPIAKPSHIPVALNSPTTGPETTTALKVPPPVAPKPKASTSETTTTPTTVPAPSFSAHHQQQLQSPPSPTASSFSCKLKLFEAQSRNGGGGGAGGGHPNAATAAAVGVGTTNNGAQSSSARPSGIPLKKPLVCAQDLEKLKEAAEQEAAMRRRAAAAAANSNTTDGKQYQQHNHHQQRQNGGGGGGRLAENAMEMDEDNDYDDDDEEADEHRDTVHELSRLLSSSSVLDQQQNGGIAGPSVVRTRKAEMRAERTAAPNHHNYQLSNATDDDEAADADPDAAGSLCRTDSSLSQRAAEIEKRREWRQARLRSMDVESKRTDELVRMITAAAAAAAAGTASAGGNGAATDSNNNNNNNGTGNAATTTTTRTSLANGGGGGAVNFGTVPTSTTPTVNPPSNNSNSTPSPIPIAP
ncbi:hypothetical protein niasHT_008430 [Heterodera trifolii]|uniref:PDZ domain-containing protein n=1 Tax=Heterodera trifolii TaxID=157864 RepID=A0ABD2M3L0_9BILA